MLELKKSNSWSFNENDKTETISQAQSLQLNKRISTSFVKQLKKNNNVSTDDTYSIINQILKTAMTFNNCKICQKRTELKQMKRIGECGHNFCADCIIQYCIYKIKINEDVLCPEQGCKTKLTQNSDIFNDLPQQMRQKFKQHLVWKQSLTNPEIKLCPNENCKGGQVDLLKIPPQCLKCHTKYCKECMLVFHQGACDKNFQQHFKQWRRCPKCKVFIQKIEGCNHMTCHCGHQFCFVCLSDWQTKHYECIQGNNRMFFNEHETMPKKQALLYLVGTLLLFPFIMAIIILIVLLVAFIAFIVGLVAAPCAAGNFLKQCGFCGRVCCLIILPFAMAIGATLAPLACILVIIVPVTKRVMTKYCNSVSFLFGQIRQSSRATKITSIQSEKMMEQVM